MVNVYIVTTHMDYEGDETIGIFSSKEKAEHYLEAVKEQHKKEGYYRDSYHIQLWVVE